VRGETSPSPVREGDYGIFAILRDRRNACYDVRAAASCRPSKEHSAGYHGNALIDLALPMGEASFR
jgi:2-methylcitrate dehydratase